MLNAIANWILANSASENLTLVCSLLHVTLAKLGFSHQFQINCNISSQLILVNGNRCLPGGN
jgi:hypothetical protein